MWSLKGFYTCSGVVKRIVGVLDEKTPVGIDAPIAIGQTEDCIDGTKKSYDNSN